MFPMMIANSKQPSRRYFSSIIERNGLQIEKNVFNAVGNILDDSGVSVDTFWEGIKRTVINFKDENLCLLAKRSHLQHELDAFHQTHPNPANDLQKYKSFLKKIGYLEEIPKKFTITTTNVDPEISQICGPQLVVPVDNARFALNAANARWGSLYDAFYNTNALFPISDTNHREERVISSLNDVLEKYFPLISNINGNYAKISHVSITSNGKLLFILNGNMSTGLDQPDAFLGYTGLKHNPKSILLKHHGLHMEVLLNQKNIESSSSSSSSPSSSSLSNDWLKDILVESALSTICDMEDSVACVDGEDKAKVYLNWLGLMKGDLSVKLANGSYRKLSQDKSFNVPSSSSSSTTDSVDLKQNAQTKEEQLVLPGRSMLLVRNVGLHMMTNAVKLNNEDIPEGILDAFASVAAGIHSLKSAQNSGNYYPSNSRYGSIYIVKPKLHSSDEVAFTMKLFDTIEAMFQLPRNTIKVGIMDEERRCSMNLFSCLNQAKSRLVFINTGFLDRTGDEIHSLMYAQRPCLSSNQMKNEKWFKCYEKNNVNIGIKIGLIGKGQIGKGMWAAPDEMNLLLKEKINHVKSGATTAWVPSPTAATLHALHYHDVDVMSKYWKSSSTLSYDKVKDKDDDDEDLLDGLLQTPLMENHVTTNENDQEIKNEMNKNVQAILGYVVRWVNQGIGCSKVPNLEGMALMEDRATLRIASQLLANWLHHGIISRKKLKNSLIQMAHIVDVQNEKSIGYIPMGNHPEKTSVAFNTALDLIFKGINQPNGYTEYILTASRLQVKKEGPFIKYDIQSSLFEV